MVLSWSGLVHLCAPSASVLTSWPDGLLLHITFLCVTLALGSLIWLEFIGHDKTFRLAK